MRQVQTISKRESTNKTGTYLSKSSMTRVVEDTVQATLIILEKIKYTDINKTQSSTEILPQEFMRPYSTPL